MQNIVTDYLPTAIATLIEPMWIVINRLLCVLQPLEQMRGAGAAASQSITLNYGSLPPQLTLFKAAKNKHYLLSVVCAMSLLANLLATSFAGLFFHSTSMLPHARMSSPPLESKFVNINGTSGPPIETSPYYNDPIAISGAYRNSAGESHFLLSESNLTRNTSLPSWTDETAMYLPFKTADSAGAADETYQARTKFFTADPRCRPLSFGEDFHMHFWPFPREDPLKSFNVKVASPNGTEITCYGADKNRFINNYGLNSMWQIGATGGMSCRNGKTAAEMATTLVAGPNATSYEEDTCRSAVAVGWMRATQKYCDRTPPKDWKKSTFKGFEDADSENTFFMLCQPEMRVGEASVLVDAAGVLQKPAEDHTLDPNQDTEALAPYFSNGAAGLISQSNLFMFRTLKPYWHNDTFASEFIHYFVHRANTSLGLADPSAALPTFADVDTPMKKAYTRLFAIWLGINKEHLFMQATTETAQVPITFLAPEERIFFVTPLFIISLAILAVYIVVSIVVYLRRPGRYLARMPTSLGAIIALFASSSALTDLRGTSTLTNAERESYLARLACRYGYGSYVGADGAVHVGVEKAPFFTHMDEVGFEGSRAALAMVRRRDIKEASASLTTVETAYEHLPLEDLEERGRYGSR